MQQACKLPQNNCLDQTFKNLLFLQPGGGQVKIAVRKLEWKAVAKTNANNEKYEVSMHPTLLCLKIEANFFMCNFC